VQTTLHYPSHWSFRYVHDSKDVIDTQTSIQKKRRHNVTEDFCGDGRPAKKTSSDRQVALSRGLKRKACEDVDDNRLSKKIAVRLAISLVLLDIFIEGHLYSLTLPHRKLPRYR
jgi:hypothetical protein